MNNRYTVPALAASLAGLLLLGIGIWLNARQALASYLAAFGFALSIALGALVYIMIGYVSGSRWFVVLRPFAESTALTLAPLALLVIPILVGARILYPWAQAGTEVHPGLRELLHEKRAYLNLPFFEVRSCAYFAFWISVVWLVRRAPVPNDVHRPRRGHLQPNALCAAALPAVALTLTFAAFDWFMSLEPVWYSTAYGLYYFAGGFSGAIATTTLMAYAARRKGLLPHDVAEDHFHACGRLLLASVALWAYLAFVQFMIIWIADIPEEGSWYYVRLRTSWRWVGIVLAVGRFVLPFFALLQRAVTRNPRRLAAVSAWILVMHFIDSYWLVLPSIHREGFRPHWLDLASLVAVVGAVVAFGTWEFFTKPRVTADNREIAASLRYESP